MEDISHILAPLNEPQRDAVTATGGNRLVLAGAGSGKTRVLVHRIAWLIQVEHLAPWSLLAVTFTNKAAREMRTRIEEILQQPIGGMWVGTFHGLAHRFLRAHWQDAKLPQHFQILDADDQLRLVKRLLKELQLDESRYPPRQVMGFINREKDEGRRPEHLDDGGDFYQRKLIEVYREYQAACERAGQVDFADLLLQAPMNCCGTARTSATTTRSASPTSWWTSSRTPMPSSTPGYGCWPGTGTISSWWATTISPSMAGAGPGWKTSRASSATIPTPRWCAWSRIIAPPAISSRPPTP